MTRLFAGGYADAGAEGLYPLVVGVDGLTVGEPVAPFVNVSASMRVPGTQRWFLVDERAARIVLAETDEGWRELASVASGGAGPCHLALDAEARMLAVANYDSGSVALFRLGSDGLPIEPPSVHQGSGHGPDAERQEGPHVHWVGFAPNGLLYATDLGTDRILRFDARYGVLGPPAIAFAAPPGSGPRQLAFHPKLPVAYLVSELASTLTLLRIGDDGALAADIILSTLPSGAEPGSLGGAILLRPDATRLYVSNRGHDSIATFALDDAGALTLVGHVPSGGRSPRFLLLAGDRLLVAHEQAGGLTMLHVGSDGLLRLPSARANVPGAAFLGELA